MQPGRIENLARFSAASIFGNPFPDLRMPFPHVPNIHVDAAGWSFIFVVGVLLPLAAMLSARRARAAPSDSKLTKRLRTVVVLLALALVAFFVARRDGVSLFPPIQWTLSLAAVSLLVLVGVIALAEGLLRAQTEQRRKELLARQTIPRGSAGRGVWLASVVIAGATEELIFRGVLFALLAAITGSIAAGAMLSAIAFALAHYRQGWKSMAFIAPIALLFQGLVVFGGSLVPAIILHAIYNVARGTRASASRLRTES
jgi:membrane protease YdiL (CAAX protease family)